MGRGALNARLKGRAASRGTAPDTRRPSERWKATPPGRPPTTPAARSPPQGMKAKGTVLGPHARTPAPTASGQRTPTARFVGEQPGEDKHLTSDAPHNGARHPLGDATPPPPQGATPARKSARCGAGSGSRCPDPPCPGHTGNGSWLPAPRDGRLGEGQRRTSDAPHNAGRPPSWNGHPPPPRHAAPRRACKPKGQCQSPHARTPAPTARGQQTPTARREDGQPEQDERLTSDAPRKGARHRPQGSPPTAPTAQKAGSQDRTLWGRCWIPHANTTPARDTPATGPGCPPPGMHGQERDSA